MMAAPVRSREKPFLTKGLSRALFVVGLSVLIAACSKGRDEDTYIARDVEVLYLLGADQLEKGRDELAAAMFDEVERQHPYSSWARRAQLMSAYSYYRANSYDDAILAAERFLSLHPGNSDAPYAYYLIALSHYEQIADVQRDQRETEQALRALTEVVRRFPATEYARDAQLKLDLTMDHLAGRDMAVGRFYQKQNQHLAAIGRFRNVIDNYQTTNHTPEALHRLVESYLALGVYPEAQQVAAVLGHNFPGSKWYRWSYNLLLDQDLEVPDDEESRGFFGRLFGGG